ncbi:GNAT family N-acetyltransferase [Pseudomonas corrugata]|uniref:GNAT family N-acetyltransferase n=1 Tax=Pseudomonas corrugata TaxID=47879 RepID=A0A7Y6DK93_9PSED|nr:MULTISPECIES: GNAT family N-acetyltransferase [Pseudomonas]NUT90073.1 GNAT family N-acetyltransferase [Pseudomonas corrugata]TNF83848.1 GNAT family N-acetyltransferase [Pseudomonas sp. ICMP22404]
MLANQHTAALIAEMDKAPPAEHWLEKLSDGTHVLIRPLSTDDHARLLLFFQRLSPLSLRLRFLGAVNHVDGHAIDTLLSESETFSQGYLALIHHEGELQVIGVSHYRRAADNPEHCGCAVAVAEPWLRKGLGRLLLGHLIDAARRKGYRKMCSTNLSTDYPVHGLYKQFGFTSAYLDRDFDRIVHQLEL